MISFGDVRRALYLGRADLQGLPIALVDLSRPYGAASQSGKRFSEEPGPARVYAPRRNVALFVQSRDALTATRRPA